MTRTTIYATVTDMELQLWTKIIETLPAASLEVFKIILISLAITAIIHGLILFGQLLQKLVKQR